MAAPAAVTRLELERRDLAVLWPHHGDVRDQHADELKRSAQPLGGTLALLTFELGGVVARAGRFFGASGAFLRRRRRVRARACVPVSSSLCVCV